MNLPGYECAQEFGSPSIIYILMDSVKLNDKKCKDAYLDLPILQILNIAMHKMILICDQLIDDNENGVIEPIEFTTITTGTIDCDLDDNCVNELMTGGARSWLDLDWRW